jgi:hypothetical protein
MKTRKTNIALDFLTSGKSIKRLFMKMQRCGLENKSIAYKIRTIVVTSRSKINLNLAPGGGTAISFEVVN